jgi:hypothetical protein
VRSSVRKIGPVPSSAAAPRARATTRTAEGAGSEIRVGLEAFELDELVAWLNEEDERDDLGPDVIPTRVRGLHDLA